MYKNKQRKGNNTQQQHQPPPLVSSLPLIIVVVTITLIMDDAAAGGKFTPQEKEGFSPFLPLRLWETSMLLTGNSLLRWGRTFDMIELATGSLKLS